MLYSLSDRYENGTKVLWNVNRRSYVVYRKVTLPMSLSDLCWRVYLLKTIFWISISTTQHIPHTKLITAIEKNTPELLICYDIQAKKCSRVICDQEKKVYFIRKWKCYKIEVYLLEGLLKVTVKYFINKW